MPFLCTHELVLPGYLCGFIRQSDAPDRIWWVGLFVNGELADTCLADRTINSAQGWPDGHGFGFNLPINRLEHSAELTLRVLNTPFTIAHLSVADLEAAGKPAQGGAMGRIDEVHSLTISGLMEDGVSALPSYEILAFEGDRIVGRSRVWRWQHVGAAGDPTGRAARFDLHLDPALADGRIHRIRVETSTGQVLAPGPVEVIAWPNRLRRALCDTALNGRHDVSQRQGDRMLERLLGASMPLSAYAALYPGLAASSAAAPPAGLIGTDGCWHSLGDSGWVLCHHRYVRPLAKLEQDLKEALREQPPTAQAPQLMLWDLAIEQADEQIFPLLFPAFDLERLLEQGHAALIFALPAEAVVQTAAASLADLLLSQVLPTGISPLDRAAILHLPHPGGLMHERDLHTSRPAREMALASAVQARVGQSSVLPPGSHVLPRPAPDKTPTGFPALRLVRPLADRSVSVIVPTRNGGQMLNTAIEDLRRMNPGFDLDILIVDNGSDEADSLASLDRLEDQGARVLEFSGGFNYALINNLAVEHARHDQLCFMNNDVAFPETGVLQELCSRLVDPGIGCVGPLMTRASDIVQHGGVVLGTWHGAAHAFEDRMLGDPGYAGLLRSASEPSAVTAAMLLTRRALFDRLGGFDERLFPVNFNDVDYCLRLGQAGYRTVLTPHVRILHLESATRGRELGTPAANRMTRELINLRARWREVLLDDPQFHPLFALDSLPYSALALEHRAPAPRRAAPRPQSELPAWT